MAEATSMHKGAKSAFDLPKIEVPEAFREFAEKGAAQTKEMYEKMRAGAEEATGLLENTFKTGATGAAEFNRKMIENARSNTNAIFDHAIALLGAKSPSEAMELSTAHARKQFEAVAHQTKELTALAQKVTAETVEPVKAGITKAFKNVA
ncbi:MAG: phasin [Xanthobacteraceae bacterium]